ncbi:MAG: hypothetical protein ABIS06_01290 [Vicinamibacterales bacterium]
MVSTLTSATKTLIHQRSFLLTASATLAIGIGAATALFSTIDAAVLKPLSERRDAAGGGVQRFRRVLRTFRAAARCRPMACWMGRLVGANPLILAVCRPGVLGGRMRHAEACMDGSDA